jgi:PhnB protein
LRGRVTAGDRVRHVVKRRFRGTASRWLDDLGLCWLGVSGPGAVTEWGYVQRAAFSVAPVPGHLHTVTPRLVVRGAGRAIDFYRAAFGAEELGERFTGPHGEVVHAELRIGDSVIVLSDETDNGAPAKSPQSLGDVVTTIMATYWEDVDAAWQQALAAGAQVVYPLADQFYGDRAGRVCDPFGQQWMLSQHIENGPAEEMTRRASAFFDPGT